MPGRRRASPQISQIPRKTISPRHKTMPRGYGADGEICAFADAPRRTAGIRCSVCVLSFSSQLLLIRKLLAPAHTSPLKSRHFPLHCQTADEAKASSAVWRGWRDLRLCGRAPANSGYPLFGLRIIFFFTIAFNSQTARSRSHLPPQISPFSPALPNGGRGKSLVRRLARMARFELALRFPALLP